MLADSSRSCGAAAGTRPIGEMSALNSDVIFSQGWHPSLQGEATAKGTHDYQGVSTNCNLNPKRISIKRAEFRPSDSHTSPSVLFIFAVNT